MNKSVIFLFFAVALLSVTNALPATETQERELLLRFRREEKWCHYLTADHKPRPEYMCHLQCLDLGKKEGKCEGDACYCSRT